MNYNQLVRDKLKMLIDNKIISPKSDYSHKGIYIAWNDGEVSATTDCGKGAYDFLVSHILGN